MESIGDILVGHLIENIRFLIRYSPESLTMNCIPIVFVLLLCIPYLIGYVKTIRYLSRIKKKWIPVDGRIDKVTVDTKGIGIVFEYSFTIDTATYQARKWKRNSKGIRSSMGEGTVVKVLVDPSDYNKSEINPVLSGFHSPVAAILFFLLLGYFFTYMLSGVFIAEYRNNHDIFIPAEKSEYDE